MIRATISGTLLLLVSYMLWLVLLAPIEWVWKQFIEARLPPQANIMKVEALSGTLFKGRGKLDISGFETIIDWRLGLPNLAQLDIPFHLSLNSARGQLPLQLGVGLTGYRADIPQASINTADLNPILRKQKVTLSGELLINQLELSWAESDGLWGAGTFSWEGGPIKYPVGRKVKSNQLPAFFGVISQEGEQTVINIRDQDSDFASISGHVDAQGVALLEVKRRILDLVEEPWPSNSKATDTVFKVKRQILPAGQKP